MKTKTITIHALDNCGSCLQAYALQQALLQHGIENEIIDYRPWYSKNNGRPLDWKFFAKRIIYGKGLKERWKVYNKFVENSLNTTKQQFRTNKELCEANLEADCFITGSDQVWNSYFECGKDLSYYLNFVNGHPKVSYAASLGRSEFDKEKLNFLKNNVQTFDLVTVRENSGCSILSSVGIKARKLCDPTFLLSAEHYRNKAHRILDESFGKYILVYLTEASDLLDKVVEQLKHRFDAKVVYVGSFRNRCKCDLNITNVGPWEFLGLIDNAEFVIAGSFHASVFSSILRKNFAVIPYENNIRMEELLNAFKLDNHFIKTEEDMSILDSDIQPMEFDNVQKIIASWQADAEKYFFNEIKIIGTGNED